jgi:thiosulfate/3-mercaptopyruvate sulfurtransferase
MSPRPVRERGYAHPELLTETDWLSEHLGDENVRVVDARTREQFEEGHIPGAVNLPGMQLYGPDGSVEIPGPDGFRDLASSIGVGDDTTLVVYDQAGPTAGRVAWGFLYYGHAHTRLLDGGLAKWAAEERALSTESSSPDPAEFTPRAYEGVYCGLDLARESVGKTGTVIWDVRAPDEYDGSNTRGNPEGRTGHLPGAVHLEWTALIDQESRTLKPADELLTLLAGIGVTPESEVVSY